MHFIYTIKYENGERYSNKMVARDAYDVADLVREKLEHCPYKATVDISNMLGDTLIYFTV